MRILRGQLAWLLIWVNGASAQEYPTWFTQLPGDLSAPVAVGYAPASRQKDRALSAAVEDGLQRLARDISAKIRSEEGFAQVGGGLRFLGRIVDEEVEPALLRSLQSAHRILDSATVNGMTLVLLSRKQDDVRVGHARKAMSVRKPAWIEEVPREKAYQFAVGVSRLYFHEESSWMAAEQSARLEMARGVLSRVQSLLRMHDGRIENVIVSETDVVLNNVQFVARWLDRENKACYVLCRMLLSKMETSPP